MDLRKIKTLIDLVRKSGVSELEITEGEDHLKIVNDHSSAARPVNTVSLQELAAAEPQPAAPEVPKTEAPAAPAPEPSKKTVTSPMVGTFYRAMAPDAAPFVQPGSAVKKGDTLCIIEAMKLLNEIEAEEDGVIEEILVENGTPVEYGQPLFILR